MARQGWRGEPGTRAPAGPPVHEPVALKACLCLASLLEAHLLIPTKEKNDVGNMWMSSPPCLGRQGPRARDSVWGGDKVRESWKYREKLAGNHQCFQFSAQVERAGESTPVMLSIIICAPFKPCKGCQSLGLSGGVGNTQALSCLTS